MAANVWVPMTTDFDNSGSNSGSSNNRPVLTNDDEGSAAWVELDKNDNAYISISLPLGLNVNLFPSGDVERDAMNALYTYLEENR